MTDTELNLNDDGRSSQNILIQHVSILPSKGLVLYH